MARTVMAAAVALGAMLSAALAQEKVTVTGQTAHYDPDAITCKRADPPAGSRIGRHQMCHTAARWKEIRMESDEAVRIMQERDAWRTHMEH